MNFAELSSYFQSNTQVDPSQIVVQSLLLLLLTTILSLIYLYTGNSMSNRSRLAMVFPLMALTTMLIITVVKSSLALSLGLVGALSIVRFRAAIKDPEELAFIFLAISLGLGFGADQILLSSVFFAVIAVAILAQSAVRGKLGNLFTDKDSVHLELAFSTPQTLPATTQILDKHCSQIKLSRLDQGEKQTMMFLLKPKSTKSIESLRQEFLSLDKNVNFTVLQYQPLL